MRKRKFISESVGTAAKNIVAVVLFFGAMLVVLWAIIVIVKLVLGQGNVV